MYCRLLLISCITISSLTCFCVESPVHDHQEQDTRIVKYFAGQSYPEGIHVQECINKYGRRACSLMLKIDRFDLLFKKLMLTVNNMEKGQIERVHHMLCSYRTDELISFKNATPEVQKEIEADIQVSLDAAQEIVEIFKLTSQVAVQVGMPDTTPVQATQPVQTLQVTEVGEQSFFTKIKNSAFIKNLFTVFSRSDRSC